MDSLLNSSTQQGGFDGVVNPEVRFNPQELLGPPQTAEYTPQAILGMYGWVGLMNRNRPPFTYWTIRDMICDPRVLFGLMLIKGPLVSQPNYEVRCNNSQVGEYITSNLDRFWTISAMRVLKALEWGYSASEILYRYNTEDGLIHFDDVRDLESLDCRPVVLRGSVIGFRYRCGPDPWGTGNTTLVDHYNPDTIKGDGWGYVGAPKALWHLHWRERNPWFGLSRLFGAHVPWYEMWSEDGYRQIRRLWFTGCAFDGGVIYHPTGTIPTPLGPRPARDYAREMVEKKRTGAVLTFPNTPSGDGTGNYAWQYQAPEGQPTPAGLLEYGEDLRSEIFEALGIPPEVIQSSGETGFGSSSGREVPQEAYKAILHGLSLCLLRDFDRCCLRYLVTSMFGPVQYELTCNVDPPEPQLPPGMEEEEGDEEGDSGEPQSSESSNQKKPQE